MIDAEAMEHGAGGGDPDEGWDGPNNRPLDLVECEGCGVEWREDQVDPHTMLCEDCPEQRK